MKAKIYGHDIEGTPEEVVKFKQLLDEQIAKLTTTYTYEYKFYPPAYIGTPITNPLKWNEIICNGT